jgi:hypothetical protein
MTLDELLIEIEQSAFVRYCGAQSNRSFEPCFAGAYALAESEIDAQPNAVIRMALLRAKMRARKWHEIMDSARESGFFTV